MKYILLLVILAACNSEKKTKADEPEDPLLKYEAQKRAKEIIEKAKEDSFKEGEAKALTEAPVKVTKARISSDEYGSKDIVITLKNISKQNADGIKVRWTLYDNFGAVVNEPYDGGQYQELLRAGKSTTIRFTLYASLATKVTAFVSDVHFTDGERWAAHKKDDW